jgi:hypothetical protein
MAARQLRKQVVDILTGHLSAKRSSQLEQSGTKHAVRLPFSAQMAYVTVQIGRSSADLALTGVAGA